MKLREIVESGKEARKTLNDMFHAKKAYKRKYNKAEARRLSLEDTSTTLHLTLGLGDRKVKHKDLEIDQLKSNVAELTKHYKKIWNEKEKLRQKAETIRIIGNVPENSCETSSKTHAPLLTQELSRIEIERIASKLQRSLSTLKRATSDAKEKPLGAEGNFATNRRFFENEKKELLKEVESLNYVTELQTHIEAARQKKLELDAVLNKFKNKRCENCEATNTKCMIMTMECSRMEADSKSKVKTDQENAILRAKLETELDEIHARQKSSISVAVQSDGPTVAQSATQCEVLITASRKIQCSPMTVEQCTQILIPLATSSTQWVDPDPKVLVESETQSEPPATKFAIATQSDPPAAKVTSSTQSDAPDPNSPVLVPTTSAQPRQSNSAEPEGRTMETNFGFSSVLESLPSIRPDTPRPSADDIKHFVFDMSALNFIPIAATTTTLPEGEQNITEQEGGMTCRRVNTPYDNHKTATKRKAVKSVPEILEAAFKKRNKRLAKKTGLNIAQVKQWLEMRQSTGQALTAEQTQAIFEPQDSMEVSPEAQVAQNADVDILNVDAEQPSSSRIPQTETHRKGPRRLVSIKALGPETEVIAQSQHNAVEPKAAKESGRKKAKVKRKQNGLETTFSVGRQLPLSPNSFAELCGTPDQHIQNSNMNQNLVLSQHQQQQIPPRAFPEQSLSSHVIQFSAPQCALRTQPQQYPAENRQNPAFLGQMPIQNLSQAQSPQYPNINYQMGQFPMLRQAIMNPPIQNPQWQQFDRQTSANKQNIGLMNSCVRNIGEAQQPNFSAARQPYQQHVLQNQQPGYQFPGSNQASASNMPPQNVYLGGNF